MESGHESMDGRHGVGRCRDTWLGLGSQVSCREAACFCMGGGTQPGKPRGGWGRGRGRVCVWTWRSQWTAVGRLRVAGAGRGGAGMSSEHPGGGPGRTALPPAWRALLERPGGEWLWGSECLAQDGVDLLSVLAEPGFPSSGLPQHPWSSPVLITCLLVLGFFASFVSFSQMAGLRSALLACDHIRGWCLPRA